MIPLSPFYNNNKKIYLYIVSSVFLCCLFPIKRKRIVFILHQQCVPVIACVHDCVFMPAHACVNETVVLNVSIQRLNLCPCITLQKERQREKEKEEGEWRAKKQQKLKTERRQKLKTRNEQDVLDIGGESKRKRWRMEIKSKTRRR